MPDNPEQIRKKLYEEYEDSLFRLVMHDAAEKEGRLFLEENEKLKNDPDFQPSAAALKNFSQQLDAHLKPKAYNRNLRLLNVLSRAAAAVLVVLVILGLTAMTVQAVRVRVLNFLIDIKPEYTLFELKESHSNKINWHNAYVLTYIPPGFEVNPSSVKEPNGLIEFRNPQGQLITYIEYSKNARIVLDTEKASVFKTVIINGHEGKLIVKKSLVTVIWPMDDRIFLIRGQIGEDTAIKMAEGVKFVD